MAMLDDNDRGPSLEARPEERWLTPFKRNAFASRTWTLVTVAAICALYAAVIAWILYRDPETPQAAQIEEIPVEVVMPPPPPPQQAKPEIEPPASSAPRAPSETKIDTSKLDEETRAPKAPTPPQDGEKAPAPEAAAPADADAHDDTAAPAKTDVLKQDAEALDKAAPLPPKKPERLAKAPPKAKRRETTALQRLAGTSDMPDYKLARPTKRAPLTGGHEDNRYLANVYAKIMANYRPAGLAPEDEGVTVTVAFEVEDDGTILQMQIVQSSGDDDLDAAAVAAVSRASPLPPLPAGAPHGLIARLGAHASPVHAQGE